MIQRIKRFQHKHPFLFIIGIAFFFRMLSVLFSKGFGMHDDHFLVIEPAQSWVDGLDYPKWLPGTPGNEGPTGHSFFYVGFHYFFFKFLQLFGIYDPQLKMYAVRFLHALLSMLVISFGYRMATLIAEKKTAYNVALLLAIYWFMPFVSVRNLVEVVCIPFLMYGTLIILRQELIRKNDEPGFHLTSYIVAGFFLGLGFSVRYQTMFYTAGLGLALLILSNWKGILAMAAGFLMSVTIFQGGVDFIIWRVPFAELTEYIRYNLSHAYDYHTQPWHHYFVVIFGVLIPPLSVMLFFGFLREWKRNLLLFLPVALFILFHSLFPNKQERFVLPVLPMIIVIGLTGWDRFVSKSKFWMKNSKLHTSLWVFFWAINISLLLMVTVMYSKRARVESMTYLRQYQGMTHFMIEDANNGVIRFPPVFYMQQWPHAYFFTKHDSYADMANWRDWNNVEKQPAFVLFYQPDNLEARVDSIKQYFPGLVFETYVKPSLMDRFIHWLNPVNANESIYIYRNREVFPEKAETE